MSALIFVALAVAWAVYLVPKALKHHDEDARSRTVDRFSHTMRVLARREPVDTRTARLVTPDGQAVDEQPAPTATRAERRAERRAAKAERAAARVAEAERIAASLTPAQVRARRAAAKRATARRRNVLGVLLLVNLVVVGLAAFGVVAWPYVAIPVVLLGAWLVLCRLMVKGEQRALPTRRTTAPTTVAATAAAAPDAEPEAGEAAETGDEPEADIDPMVDTSAGIAAIVDPSMWDPVPVTLPTYVTKPAATRRTVRTIDLESTGVWTSGRTDADAQIAREADEAEKAEKAARSRHDGEDRAVGS